MLSVGDLSNLTVIPDIKNIELNTIAEFYLNKICSNKYTYTLADNSIISLQFDKTALCHLMGIHYYNNDAKLEHDYEGIGGFNNIQAGKLTMQKLVSNTKAFGQHKNRILYFPFLPTLLTSPSFIYFDNKIVNGNCKINASITLHKEYAGTRLRIHLFAGTDDSVRYYPITYIIHKNDKYIDKQTPIAITAINIESLENDINESSDGLVAATIQSN